MTYTARFMNVGYQDRIPDEEQTDQNSLGPIPRARSHLCLAQVSCSNVSVRATGLAATRRTRIRVPGLTSCAATRATMELASS